MLINFAVIMLRHGIISIAARFSKKWHGFFCRFFRLRDAGDIKNLPKSINSPIAVFNSTRQDGAKIILTELQRNGYNFVVVINAHINPLCRKINISVNDIKSLYPKDNITDLINWFKSGNKLIAWIDKEKALSFISTQSTNLIGGGNKTQDSICNIVKNFANVK